MTTESEYRAKIIRDMYSRAQDLLRFYRNHKDLCLMFYAELHKNEWLRFSIPEQDGDQCMKIAIRIPEEENIDRYTIFVNETLLFISDDTDEYSFERLREMYTVMNSVYGCLLVLLGSAREPS